MMRIWMAAVLMGASAVAVALPVRFDVMDNPDVPQPQDALLAPTIPGVLARAKDMQMVLVVVQMGLGEENPRWVMSQTQMAVFLDKLATLPEKPVLEDRIWPKLPELERNYKGVVVLMQTVDGKRFQPLRVFAGKLTTTEGALMAKDFGRYMEYWLFGTARVRRDQLLGVTVLPVMSFEQCRLLGQRVVETTPRQCLLPDNNLLLETSEKPTLEAARIRDFDDCLLKGKGLIYTFPRRCVAAGGRVFTEPPRVEDEPKIPADAPLAGVVSGTGVSATAKVKKR